MKRLVLLAAMLAALSGAPALAQQQTDVAVNVHADGSVNIEGKRYALDKLKPKMEELMKRKPIPFLRIVPDKGVPFATVSRVMTTIQQSGWESAGRVNP